MRRLIYVPIIHGEADIGSIGAALEQESTLIAGGQRWTLHKQTVDRYWSNVAVFLDSFEARSLKVYQDGLAVGGEAGGRIVEEAARRGSKNYQLVLELINRGAELRATEDLALLKEERENILGFVGEGVAGTKGRSAQEYRFSRDRLMEERDRFIGETINATLKEGEVGVLFIGAYHRVAPHLEKDIAVEFTKEPSLILAYIEELFTGQNQGEIEELAQHLISPISTV